ncbi:putative FliH domain-containing protein [Candidatus Hydrogenisulfobacillus filiaventi]|uniref:Putative FliH domain-containing protein n=1 Tax=Candidatus Hydrogenisulfobacillus filiaventi TaxID=2707344 RepID=A0A6F8ZDK2_9FIRM|nr:hypothetical protein [Bacillota bacterium]CAB1128011.1 putative FliH domain-containing protein [Candidatus Hydrogenisulfobacillus filiaventi]
MSPKAVIKLEAQRRSEEPLALEAAGPGPDWGPVEVEARRVAAEVLAQARSEAERLLEEARVRAGDLEVEARRRGEEAGRAAAYAEAAATAAGLLESLRARVAEAEAALGQVLGWLKAREDPLVLGLAAALAEAAWGRAVAEDPGRLLQFIREAAAALEEEAVTVYLPPGTLARLRALGDALATAPALRWQARPGLDPGAVLLRFAGGGRDASPVAVLTTLLRRALEGEAGGEEAGP